MGTSVLTPNNPDPITGLKNSIIGWHFVGASVMDVLLGCNTIYLATNRVWYPGIQPVPTDQSNPPLWQIIFTKDGNQPIIVSDTQWFAFDGQHIWVFDESTVKDDYTITAWTPPDPPVQQ